MRTMEAVNRGLLLGRVLLIMTLMSQMIKSSMPKREKKMLSRSGMEPESGAISLGGMGPGASGFSRSGRGLESGVAPQGCSACAE